MVVGEDEAVRSCRVAGDPEEAQVVEAVVGTAERECVVEIGEPPVLPVPVVVQVEAPALLAPRSRALAAVAVLDEDPLLGAEGPLLATELDRDPVRVLDEPADGGVAGEAAADLGRECRPEVDAGGGAHLVRPHVEDHLVLVARRPVAGQPGEGGACESDEGVGPGDAGGRGVPVGVGVAITVLGVAARLERLLDEGAEFRVEVGAAPPTPVVTKPKVDPVPLDDLLGRRVGRRFVLVGGSGPERVPAGDRAHLADGGVMSERSELGVVGGRHVEAHLDGLVLRQGAGGQGGGGNRQPGRAARQCDEPPGPTQRHAALPRQPLRRGADAGLRPDAGLDRLRRELDDRPGGGVDEADVGSQGHLHSLDSRRRRRLRRTDLLHCPVPWIEHVFDPTVGV